MGNSKSNAAKSGRFFIHCDIIDLWASSCHHKQKLPSITRHCLLPAGCGLMTPPLDFHQFQVFISRKIFFLITQCTIKVLLTADLGCFQMDFHKTKELSAYQIIHMFFCLFIFNWRIATILCGLLPCINVAQPQVYICPHLLELPSHSSRLSQGPSLSSLSLCICFLICVICEAEEKTADGGLCLSSVTAVKRHRMPSGGVRPPSQCQQSCGPGQQGSCRVDSVCLYFFYCTRRVL